MTDNPEIAAAQQEWWDKSLTSAGRSDILKAARLKLPARVLWRHMSDEVRAAVDHMRPSEFRPEDRAARQEPIAPEPSVTITDLKVENAILRGNLRLTVNALRDYHDAPHFEIDGDGPPMREVIVPETLRPRAADALARAEKMLQEPEQGRGR